MASAETGIMRNAMRIMIIRELWALDREIAAYPDDASLWKTASGISNSAGSLTLHLAGNLQHFIGATLGQTGYVRDRDAEFTTKHLSREVLRQRLREAIADLEVAFEKLTDDQLKAEYPLPVQERRLRTADFLLHLAVHLSYHLGQIDYHRRLLTGSSEAVNAMAVKELEELES